MYLVAEGDGKMLAVMWANRVDRRLSFGYLAQDYVDQSLIQPRDQGRTGNGSQSQWLAR